MTESAVSIGVAGALGPSAIARIAQAVEAAGLHALWVNDTPHGDSLAALAAAARATSTLTLATGVVPLDRRPAPEIAAAVADLPQDRVVLGVGSGATRRGALDLVSGGVAALREATSARVMVGALGPRMRALAARAADGPLLSWLTPHVAAEQSARAHADGAPAAALYVRTALDPAARERLADETARYASAPGYAANFARLGIEAADTILDPETFARGIRDYRSVVDEVVLRAIVADDDVASYERFIAEVAAHV